MTAHLTFQVLWDSLMRSLEPMTLPFLQARALSNSRRLLEQGPTPTTDEADVRHTARCIQLYKLHGITTCC
ncbi:hypothetical protein AV530_009790 [Patagioenas fasciata monilis]|uniref:Uncharacterized protein n=1 Tax=Patagioenas fasciata monilis TaxID=372326 RepID=A0A1V4KA21_PATFA|nr:hypothetical protein AV530_009790 [Patagioenas fasciata monilis]